MRQLPSLSQPIIQVVIVMPVTILLRPLAKPVHFTIRKSAKVRNACEPTIILELFYYLNFNHKRT
ncbi:TPA: hypothetical protein ACGOY2_001428 [Streptococcus suis]